MPIFYEQKKTKLKISKHIYKTQIFEHLCNNVGIDSFWQVAKNGHEI